MTLHPSITLGPIRQEDWPILADIELSAAQLFRNTPYPELSESACCSLSMITEHFASGGLGWAARNAKGQLSGFLIAHDMGDCLHIDELSVQAADQGQGIGAALLEHCIEEARGLCFQALSLTTYRDIAWNGPFYARYGFETVTEGTCPDWLSRMLLREIAAGAKAQTRIAMQLVL